MSGIDDRTAGGRPGRLSPGDPFEDGSLDTPNCPSCLHPMEAASTGEGRIFWSCPSCGQAQLG